MSEEEDSLQENVISEGDVIENVHISPIGDFNGSDSEGNAVPESIDRESLEVLAEKLNAGDEVLFDTDHQSTRAGEGRNTRAAGWFSKFFVDPVKGLFARLKLTKWGKELVSGREYRYVSPTFGLDENGKPVELYSIAATNTPAFAGAMSPILNQAPSESAGGEEQHVSTEEQEISPMEIEKLKEELLEALHEEVASLADAAKEAKEEPAEQAVNEGDAPLVDKEAKPEAAEESKEDADAGVQVVEASSEEPAGQAEAPVQEEEKAEEREVIKIEALNSAPAPTLAPQPEAWRSMTPEQFCKWVEAGMPK